MYCLDKSDPHQYVAGYMIYRLFMTIPLDLILGNALFKSIETLAHLDFPTLCVLDRQRVFDVAFRREEGMVHVK